MKYMLLMHGTRADYQHAEWAPDDWQAHLAYWARLNRELRDAAELVEVHALAAPGEAPRVRAGADGAPVTDGPFAESKEFLAGFWVVDAATPERAYAIAARASAAPGPGGAPLNLPIEVRAVAAAPPA